MCRGSNLAQDKAAVGWVGLELGVLTFLDRGTHKGLYLSPLWGGLNHSFGYQKVPLGEPHAASCVFKTQGWDRHKEWMGPKVGRTEFSLAHF